MRRGLSPPVGDEAPGRAGAKLAQPRFVALKDVMQEAGSSRLGEELGPEADEGPGRDEILHSNPPGAVVDHLLQTALAAREELGHDTEVLFGNVDRDPLDR